MIFRNLMNGVALSSLMLRDADDEAGAADSKTALREKLAKGNLAPAAATPSAEASPSAEEEEGDEEEEEGEEAGDPVDPAEETDEQKAAREAQEKIAAKAKRKDERMQRRIDTAIAEKKAADAEIARLKAQIEASPEQKLRLKKSKAEQKLLLLKRLLTGSLKS